MSACFEIPKAALVNRRVPKERIYTTAGASARVRQRFIDEVDRITWRATLAEQLNLRPGKEVEEILVFEVALKGRELDDSVLAAIDKGIVHPILFELRREGTGTPERKLVAAWKRVSESDRDKRVTSGYFASDCEPADAPRRALPQALDLGALYVALVDGLVPVAARPGETMTARVARAEAIAALEREIERLRARVAGEKQFNKQVAINEELRAALKELNALQCE